MSSFDRAIAAEYANDTKLGIPAPDDISGARRMNAMSIMRGGNGFRTPPKPPKVYADGMTRGDRERSTHIAANAKVSEVRAPEFMHSHARCRAERTMVFIQGVYE